MNINWVSYDKAASHPDKTGEIGGLGGMFRDGYRWKDYCDPGCEYYESLRKSILDNNLRITGEEHQESDNGAPMFEDGTVGLFSWRAWGDLMAAVWSEKEDKNYNYMDFYMQRENS